MTKKEVIEWLKKNPGGLGDEFVVKRKVASKKQTFEVAEDVLERFYDEAHKRGLKIKEAIDQAMRGWLEK